MKELPEGIPTVNAVEFAAEMAKSWKLQTDRIIRTIIVLTGVGVGLISGINMGLQYRISRAGQILESTRFAAEQNRVMIDGLREDRSTADLRFRTLMGAIQEVGRGVDRREKRVQ